MATKQAHKRLMKEYAAIQQQPPPFIVAKPSEKNILEWHYVITGPPDSPFHQGEYHGKIVFPAEYPFKPPSIQMLTPNGRFKTHTRLCLSMSDYHPEQWNPSWSVASILTGLLSFMLESTPTTGSYESTDQEKRILARQSRGYNREQNQKFAEVFPDLYREPVELPTQPSQSSEQELETLSGRTSRDILDQDVVMNEFKYFITSGGLGWILGGLILALGFSYLFNWNN